MINYKDTYVLLRIEREIPFDSTDQGKSQFLNFSILKTLLKLLKISRLT